MAPDSGFVHFSGLRQRFINGVDVAFFTKNSDIIALVNAIVDIDMFMSVRHCFSGEYFRKKKQSAFSNISARLRNNSDVFWENFVQ